MNRKSIAVTYWLPKTSALMFDEVLCIDPQQRVPDDVAVVARDATEREILAGQLSYEIECSFHGEEIDVTVRPDAATEREMVYGGRSVDDAFREMTRPWVRDVSTYIESKLPVLAHPVYHSFAEYSRDYSPGETQVVVGRVGATRTG